MNAGNLSATKLRYDELCLADQGVGVIFWNCNASLGLNLEDEGFQSLMSPHELDFDNPQNGAEVLHLGLRDSVCKWEPKNDPLWELKKDPPLEWFS